MINAKKIFIIFMASIIVATFAVMGEQVYDCSESGGKLVRGLILFECIGEKK